MVHPYMQALTPDQKVAVNARFYPALTWLFVALALMAAGTALTLKTPMPDAFKRHALEVEEVGEIVLQRNEQHMGYSVFLAEPKPAALAQDLLLGVKNNWLPFHRDLKVTPEQIDAWDDATPAKLDVTTYQGMVVGLASGSDVMLNPNDFGQAVARKRLQRWGMAGAALLAALGCVLFGMRRKPSHASR